MARISVKVEKLPKAGSHPVYNIDRVRSRLLLNDQLNGIFAVETGQAARFHHAVFRVTHVPDHDRATLKVSHDEIVKVLGVFDASHRPQHQLAAHFIDSAAGDLDILGLNGPLNLSDGKVVGRELVRIDVKVNGPLLLPDHDDLSHPA